MKNDRSSLIVDNGLKSLVINFLSNSFMRTITYLLARLSHTKVNMHILLLTPLRTQKLPKKITKANELFIKNILKSNSIINVFFPTLTNIT